MIGFWTDVPASAIGSLPAGPLLAQRQLGKSVTNWGGCATGSFEGASAKNGHWTEGEAAAVCGRFEFYVAGNPTNFQKRSRVTGNFPQK